jgi:hypothetical protein
MEGMSEWSEGGRDGRMVPIASPFLIWSMQWTDLELVQMEVCQLIAGPPIPPPSRVLRGVDAGDEGQGVLYIYIYMCVCVCVCV